MAIQTQQRGSSRTVGLWQTVAALAGAAVGVGLLAGSLIGGSVTMSPPAPAPHAAVRNTPLGIDLPAGAERSQLPAGLTDYILPDR